MDARYHGYGTVPRCGDDETGSIPTGIRVCPTCGGTHRGDVCPDCGAPWAITGDVAPLDDDQPCPGDCGASCLCDRGTCELAAALDGQLRAHDYEDLRRRPDPSRYLAAAGRAWTDADGVRCRQYAAPRIR